MSTLTLDEFNTSKTRFNKLVYDKIMEYYNSKRYGLNYDSEVYKELYLYILVINSWEQDKFNSINFSNYLNSNSIQFIFNKINKLI